MSANPKSVSSTYGKIKTVLFTHYGAKWNNESTMLYTNIMESLGRDVLYVFLAIVDIPSRFIQKDFKKHQKTTNENKLLTRHTVNHTSQEQYLERCSRDLKQGFDFMLSSIENEDRAKAIEKPLKTIFHIKPRVDYGAILKPNRGRGRRIYNTSKWAQDSFWVLQGDDYSVLIEPLDPSWLLKSRKPFADTYVADHIAASIKLEKNFYLEPSLYQLQGGNILCGTQWIKGDDETAPEPHDFLLVGNGDLDKNVSIEISRMNQDQSKGTSINTSPQQIKADIKSYFKTLFRVQNVYFTPDNVNGAKKKFQPLYHLDQYITLAGGSSTGGKEVVMVADLKWGVETFMKAAGMKTPKTDAATACAELKRMHTPFLMCDQGLILRLEQTVKEFERKTDDSGKQMFKVHRLPMLLIDYAGVPYIITYNNCFIEIYRKEGKEIKKAYLPNFETKNEWFFLQLQAHEKYGEGLKAVKDAVKDQFVNIGYPEDNVHFVNGEYAKTAAQRGALHCIAKVLERSDYVLNQ